MSKVLLKNIGTIVSGDISKPIIEGDAIRIKDGKIKNVGPMALFAVNVDTQATVFLRTGSCINVLIAVIKRP